MSIGQLKAAVVKTITGRSILQVSTPLRNVVINLGLR